MPHISQESHSLDGDAKALLCVEVLMLMLLIQ